MEEKYNEQTVIIGLDKFSDKYLVIGLAKTLYRISEEKLVLTQNKSNNRILTIYSHTIVNDILRQFN